MVDVLATDLTGQNPANRVTEDIKLNRQNRAFPLSKGSFFTKSLRVVNKANQALLAKDRDYRLGELDIEAIRLTPQHEICKEIIMLSTSVDEITVTYQAIGGEFQFNSTSLAAMLKEYFDTVGKTHIVNTPDQYAPSKHIQNINDFMKLGGVEKAITRIEEAIRNGKGQLFIESILLYTEELGNALSTEVKQQANELLEQVNYLKKRNEYRDGRYYITSRSTNPSADKGGAWTLDPNVTLYGAENGSQVGQLVNVGEGEGYLATFRHLWRRNDTGEIVIYDLQAGATEIDEGGSVLFTLRVGRNNGSEGGLPAGTRVPWRITGVDADDILGGQLSGEFVIDSVGYAAYTVTTLKDRKTEGVETMRLSLVNAPTNYINVAINDTSLTPIYMAWFSSDVAGNSPITSINEGMEGYLQLGGNDLNQGERLYLLLDESTTNTADFDIILPQFLDINNGRASAKFKLKNDNTTEGTELIVVNVCTTPSINTRQVRTTCQVIDTSKSPVYRSRFSLNADGSGTITQANEGTVVYMVIEGDNVAENTTVQVSYSGTANADDFNAALPASAIMRSGKAILQYSIKNDLRTEGNETFTATVSSGGVAVTSSQLIIIDTSITLGYDMFFSSTSAGNDRVTAVNEGDVAYLCVRTVGIADGTRLRLEYSGTATMWDFLDPRPDYVTITAGFGWIGYRVSADRLTEGNESFGVTLADVYDRPSATVWLVDTSLTPTISTKWSSNDRGTDVITSTPEGRSIYLIIETTGMIDADGNLGIRYGGNVDADDFIDGRPDSVKIWNNRAVIEYKVKADAKLEGTERFEATVFYYSREEITSTSAIDILDTSIPPNLQYSIWVEGAMVQWDDARAMSGQSVEIRVTDVNRTLAHDAFIYVNYNAACAKGPVTLTNRITAIPERIQMSNWVARLNYSYLPELQGVETFAPFAFGLSAAEAATPGGAWTNTFLYANVQHVRPEINSWFSASYNGEPYYEPVNGEQPLWFVSRSPNIPNGANGTLRIWVNGTYATVDNGLLTRDYTGPMTYNNGFTSQQLFPNPTSYDGVKYFEAFMQNNTLTANIPGTTVKMNILPPPSVDVDIYGAVYRQETYNGNTYGLIASVNLYDYFYSVMGRVPRANEKVNFFVGGNTSIVANNRGVSAIDMDSRWNGSGEVTLVNRGIILGRGGDGGNIGIGTPGGWAINNSSGVRLRVRNYSIIAGGGGGGHGASGTWNNLRGGGGAPFGNGQDNGGWYTPGGARPAGGKFTGAGGNWGQKGSGGTNTWPGEAGGPGRTISGLNIYEIFNDNGELLGDNSEVRTT